MHIKIIEPKEIDDALEHPTNNLNRLEAQKSAEIILEAKPNVAILDCPSVNISAYKYDVKKYLGDLDVDIKPSHKADVYFPCVAAASIIAKHTRDTILEKLKKVHDMDFGSG